MQLLEYLFDFHIYNVYLIHAPWELDAVDQPSRIVVTFTVLNELRSNVDTTCIKRVYQYKRTYISKKLSIIEFISILNLNQPALMGFKKVPQTPDSEA